MNTKGQESAPFEVLVSVVIMGFVIVIAMVAIDTVTKEQCKAEIKRSGTELKIRIEEVSKGNDTTLLFSPPKCFNQRNEIIKISSIKSRSLCSLYCGGTKEECLVFDYQAGDEHGELICLANASILTQFITTPGTACQDRTAEGYQLEDFRSAIPRGNYILVNNNADISALPQVCAYRKMAG